MLVNQTVCHDSYSPSDIQGAQAFVALQSGEIKTYDLICLRKSPYVLPNMWTLYEEQTVSTSIPEASSPGS